MRKAVVTRKLWTALLLTLLTLCISFTSAAAAPPANRIPVRRIQAPTLRERAGCDNDAQCGRSQFCNNAKVCQPRLMDGESCTSASQKKCLSGICDAASKKCASSQLSVGSSCQSSDACLTGNCFYSKCRAKSALNAFCYKDTNCQSGSCDIKTKKCIKASQTPIHPVVPWDTDLSDLRNLAPTRSRTLFYTDSGTFDPAIVQLFAAMQITPKYPTVILSHSSWVGQISCQGNTIEIPFKSAAAYNYAARHWDSVGPFLVVTHTEGCAPSTKIDERTFWLVQGLTLDPTHKTIDATAKQVALEDAVGHIEINFGQKSGGETAPTVTSTMISPTATATESTSTALPTSTSLPPEDYSNTVGACLNKPAACSTDFDRVLDDAMGYYNFDDDFSNSLRQFAPGLPSYDPSYYDALVGGTDGSLVRRDMHILIKRGFWGRIVKAVVKVAIKVTVAQVKAVVRHVVAPVLRTAVKVLGRTPLGRLIDYVVSRWTPSISGLIPFNWKPINAFDSPWGKQARFFQTEKGKSTTKDKDGKDKKKALLLYEKKPPKAEAKAQGSVTVFCVDCYIKGHFAYKGTLAFSLAEARITKCTVEYDGKLDANIQLGLEAHATLEAEYRRELGRIPLPGGFVLKDVVSVGPSMVFETSIGIKLDAQVDLLLGVGFHVPAFYTYLDLVDQTKSKQTNNGAPYFTSNTSIAGSALARASFGIPMSLSLGLIIHPLKVKKEVTLRMEPAILALAMTASDEDKFEDQKLEPCDLGMAWKVGTGVSFGLNLFDWSKYPLGKINGPQLAQGCIPIFTEAELLASEVVAVPNTTVSTTSTSVATPTSSTSVSTSTMTSTTSSSAPTSTMTSTTTASTSSTSVTASTVTAPTTTPTTCSNNTGVGWAYYSSPYENMWNMRNFSTFMPEYFKSRQPLDQGVTNRFGYVKRQGSSTFYNSTTLVDSSMFALNHRGYFVPPVAGVYTFRAYDIDDIVLFWISSGVSDDVRVKQTYSRDNADFGGWWNNVEGMAGDGTRSFTLPAGAYIPFRLYHGDGAGSNGFAFNVTGPNGFTVNDFYNSMVQQSCDGTTAPPFDAFGSEGGP